MMLKNNWKANKHSKMMKKYCLFLLLFYISGFSQSYQFDAFVEIYHEVPRINYKGSQVLLLNTSDNKITAFSHADSTFTIYDNERNLCHTFLNKTTKNKYHFVYIKSCRLNSKEDKYKYEIKKITDKKYEITEYKNEKQRIITFKIVVELENSEANLLSGISSDIGEKRRSKIINTLEKEVGNKENFKITNQLTFYSKENIIDKKTVNSGSVNIQMITPTKLKFKN